MKIKNIITLSIFSLLLLVLTSCSSFNGVKLKEYKNEVDYLEYIQKYTEINKNNDFYNGDYDLELEGKASKVNEMEEYVTSKNTGKSKYTTNLDFNLAFDKDSMVYNFNLKSNQERNIKYKWRTDKGSYKGDYDYTYQIEGKNFYSLNNDTKDGLKTPINSDLASNIYLASKLLKDVETITRKMTNSIDSLTLDGERRYYVDSNVFTTVTTFNDKDKTYEVVLQEVVNTDNKLLLAKATLTKNYYDDNHKLYCIDKNEYNLEFKLNAKELDLKTKNVDKYNIVLVK